MCEARKTAYSLFSCLTSRWRPHPRGDVPPRLPLEPLRRPTQQNFQFQLA